MQADNVRLLTSSGKASRPITSIRLSPLRMLQSALREDAADLAVVGLDIDADV